MTEEIIIDGVNVAGCEYALTPKKQCPVKPMYYAKETSCIACKEHNTKLNFCKNNPNCYYKQLIRLEQENNAYKQSEQEATEIIAELKEYSQRMENQRENYYKEYKKYRSALEEIQRVINLAYKTGDYLLGQDYTDLVDTIEKELEVLND